MTKGRIVSIIGLLFFLVGLPYGSYIYLKKGYDYQKEAIKDLRKDVQLTLPGSLVHLAGQHPGTDLSSSMYIIGLLPASAGNKLPQYGEVLAKLHEQFDIPTNIHFWSVFEDRDSAFVANFTQFHTIPQDTAQLVYWAASPDGFADFVTQLGITDEEKANLPGGLLVLVDESLFIRRAYALTDDAMVKQLVERIAMLLPDRSKPKPELRRETEK